MHSSPHIGHDLDFGAIAVKIVEDQLLARQPLCKNTPCWSDTVTPAICSLSKEANNIKLFSSLIARCLGLAEQQSSAVYIISQVGCKAEMVAVPVTCSTVGLSSHTAKQKGRAASSNMVLM